MKRNGILYLILVFVLIFVFTTESLAQTVEPPGLESGVSADLETLAPDNEIQGYSPAFSGGPAYDSGWVALGLDQTKVLYHRLGGNVDHYVVDMQYRGDSSNGVNQRYYGGADFGSKPPAGASADDRVGAYWRSLTTSSITVYRRPEDIFADFVRVRIWVDSQPTSTDKYDSGWRTLGTGLTATLAHNLGGNASHYVVDLQYRSAGSGINQRYYGGADFGATTFNGTRQDERVGLYWRSLDVTNITVFRRAEDDYADQYRVRIWRRPHPTYDSGWFLIGQDQAIVKLHSIGGDPDGYVVDLQYYSSGSGINQRYYGGADFGALPPAGMAANDRVGAYWRSLNANSIVVYRRPEDIYADYVRVRIWSYWQPSVPDYDSNWVNLNLDQALALNHQLGGDVARYYVEMQYRGDAANGINQRYLGGADFGTKPAPGQLAEDRVGAYWRSLTTSYISVYRRPEDSYANQLRVRIWQMPRPSFDSGWVSLVAGGAATALTHNLYGDPGAYLVDLQYRSAGSGINQRYFGGADFGTNPPAGASANDREGAYWRNLTNTSITVYRRPDDIYAEEVRLRIWFVAQPDYDSGWRLISQDQSTQLNHNLGSPPEAYLVDHWQWDGDVANLLNQRHLGGADFGNLPPLGYSENDRVGSYWRSLTGTSLVIYRRPEDGFADWVRIRIWDYSRTIYLPVLLQEN